MSFGPYFAYLSSVGDMSKHHQFKGEACKTAHNGSQLKVILQGVRYTYTPPENTSTLLFVSQLLIPIDFLSYAISGNG